MILCKLVVERGLEYGQTLILSGDEKISKLIIECVNIKTSDIQVKYVIEFVLINVVKTIKEGFLIFAANGKHYFEKKDNIEKCLRNEISTLEELYLDSFEEKTIYEYVESKDEESNLSIKNINEYVKKYASDETILKSNQDEECEREKEKQIEMQKEKKMQYQKYTARNETKFLVREFREILLLTKDFIGLKWNLKIDLSENFLRPLEDSVNGNWDEYLQIINYLLIDDKRVVIITDREAER